MAKFFGIPFAASASKSTIPDSDSTNVSWNGGYTANYEYNPLTNKQAKHIERDTMNTLFYEITSSIQQIQLNGIAPYFEAIIATTGPGYSEGAMVNYGGKIWRSKISANRVIPNANSTKNWEIVYGYDTLVTQLEKDGHLSGSGGGSGNGYSKEEIDNKLKDISLSVATQFIDSAYNILGEIYLLTWCDTDRNSDGFFLCNGDELPYIPEGEDDDGSDPLTYYGNTLFDLCYTTDDNNVTTESDFKKRWGIVIDESKKVIKLPNILGKDGDTIVSDSQSVVVTLGRTAKLPDYNGSSEKLIKTFAKDYDLSEAADNGDAVIRVALLPCIYLGTDIEENSQ